MDLSSSSPSAQPGLQNRELSSRRREGHGCAHGVSDGDPSAVPALPLTLSLPLGAGTETFQLKAFKLTVCKLFKRTQGQLEEF